jgi:hypothetical protein
MAAVGLRFDLSAWRKGVSDAATLVKKGLGGAVMKPFDTAIRKTGMALRSTFGSAGKFIKGVLTSAFAPLIALLAVGAIIRGIKEALTGSLAAYRDYSDSVTTLQSALRSMGEGVDVSGATAEVKKLGDQLRLTMGIAGAETNRVMADMLTRGFTGPQARQLTILAANFAKKTGKPLQDVARLIGDAANGSAEAIKGLGVQIAPTGNRVKDAEAAVLALKAAYGDIGADLANPSERLAAAWGQLAVSLGEKISPIIEPLVQGFADFVTGLTQTEEGEKMLTQIAETLKGIIDWTMYLARVTVNFVDVIKGTGSVIWAYLNKLFNDIMESLFTALRALPGGDWLLEQMGFSPEHAAEAFAEGSREAAKKLQDATGPLLQANENFWSGRDNAMIGGVKDVMDAGKRSREEAAASLSQEMAATRGMGFAGNPAMQQEAARAAAAQGTTQGRGAQRTQRVRGTGSVQSGQRLDVRIVSARGDRFRKTRMA